MGQMIKPEGEDLKRYIKNNIDKAVSENWIKVFYQPVVRTLTGEVCGMEALARWIDPEFGMISPLEFIGTLEEARLIHKLDSHMIRKICEDYSTVNVKGGAQSGTVSFNLSRLDFSLCDIHQIIEDAIKKNKVPREALRVEITESTMENDSTLMHDVIDRFWERGLRVWMDDFGSGYSSLNVLKDYHFDTLKIDMVFLRNFDPRSREIIRSVVDMAKRLGIHTLAEGVETAEQLEFLKNIGCEKAQGYYIGKPMPYEECYKYLMDSNMHIESAGKRQYYHDIGRVNLLSATPLEFAGDEEVLDTSEQNRQNPIALIEMTGSDDEITYLYANDAYRKLCLELGAGTLPEIEKEYSEGLTEVKGKFTQVLRRARESRDVVMSDFIKNGHYCYTRVRLIAEYPGGSAFIIVLQDMTKEESSVRTERLNDALITLCGIYDYIVAVDLETGYSEAVFHPTSTESDYHKIHAAKELIQYANEEIFPEDRPGFIEFTDLSTIEERLDRTSVGHISAPFRTRTTNGSYIWMLYSFIRSGREGERKVLSCMRKLPESAIARLYGDRSVKRNQGDASEADNSVSDEVLWKNFVNNSDTGFFWKDKDRRFLGANRKMLEYFGYDSDEVLIGRTDEEMGWHVDSEVFRLDEERVIEKGEQTYLVPGTIICKGELRQIASSKFPLYLNGEIVGLMGYFLDTTEINAGTIVKKAEAIDCIDRESLRFMEMMEYALTYQNAYKRNKSDFAMAIFSMTNLENYRSSYGNNFCDLILESISKRISGIIGNSGVSGRVGSEYFLVIRQTADKAEMDELVKRVIADGEAITEVKGAAVTPYMGAGYAFYSEVGNFQDLYTTAIKRLRNQL
ncbi:MAG: EAL domain-containing protein [Lachnospiraceae bacterium]|nr:EAL domain-containing protein [Lachnospiraceae bacterium]